MLFIKYYIKTTPGGLLNSDLCVYFSAVFSAVLTSRIHLKCFWFKY